MFDPVSEIKERLNIVDVIQEYISLKKAGANHKGLCPFHSESTPSFTVSESKQFFHCFGCGKGGDVFTFIQEVESVEFPEALRMLATKAGVELKEVDPRASSERTRLLDCVERAALFFHTTLLQSPEAAQSRAYVEKRGIAPETVNTFQLGYSLDTWDALLQNLKKHSFRDTEIERCGLAIRSPKTGGFYDRFRGRLMFPIHNVHGNVVGFGARTLDPQQKEAKYINSPQTSIYNKSAVVYGLHIAKKHIQRVDATVIVEGYMDVIAAHQAQFRNVVAASGTALTEEQVRLLKRYSQNTILAFDADTAGVHAAWRGMQVAIQQGMNIKVLRLPQGQDPDDVIRIDPNAFRESARAALPFMEYAFTEILRPLDLQRVDHKKRAAQELLPMIALFPDSIEQTHYIQRLAAILGVEEQILHERLKAAKTGAKQSHTSTNPSSTHQSPSARTNTALSSTREHVAVELIFVVLSVYPGGWQTVSQPLATLLTDGPLYELYKEFNSQYNQTGSIDVQKIQGREPATQQLWQRLQVMGEEELYVRMSEAEKEKELATLVEGLERHRIQRRLKEIEQGLAHAEKQHDRNAIDRLSEEFRVLRESLRKF